jgi:hypothetical protein
MFSLDDRTAPPETPAFRADMEQFLVSVARLEPRRSRPTRRALIAVAAGGAAVAIAIGAAVAAGGPSGAPGRVGAGPVHLHLADFSVDTNPGGTVTVTLSQAQIRDPNALRQALARAGVPARITIGSFCYNPVPDRSALLQAVAMNKPAPGEASDVVITPSKLPAGSTLAIGYAMTGGRGKAHFDLLTAGAAVTCSGSPPPVAKEPVPAPPPGSKEPAPPGGEPGPAASR